MDCIYGYLACGIPAIEENPVREYLVARAG